MFCRCCTSMIWNRMINLLSILPMCSIPACSYSGIVRCGSARLKPSPHRTGPSSGSSYLASGFVEWLSIDMESHDNHLSVLSMCSIPACSYSGIVSCGPARLKPSPHRTGPTSGSLYLTSGIVEWLSEQVYCT